MMWYIPVSLLIFVDMTQDCALFFWHVNTCLSSDNVALSRKHQIGKKMGEDYIIAARVNSVTPRKYSVLNVWIPETMTTCTEIFAQRWIVHHWKW